MTRNQIEKLVHVASKSLAAAIVLAEELGYRQGYADGLEAYETPPASQRDFSDPPVHLRKGAA